MPTSRLNPYLMELVLQKYEQYLRDIDPEEFKEFNNKYISVYERSLTVKNAKTPKWLDIFVKVAASKGATVLGVLPHYGNGNPRRYNAHPDIVLETEAHRYETKSKEYRQLLCNIRAFKCKPHKLAFVQSLFIDDDLIEKARNHYKETLKKRTMKYDDTEESPAKKQKTDCSEEKESFNGASGVMTRRKSSQKANKEAQKRPFKRRIRKTISKQSFKHPLLQNVSSSNENLISVPNHNESVENVETKEEKVENMEIKEDKTLEFPKEENSHTELLDPKGNSYPSTDHIPNDSHDHLSDHSVSVIVSDTSSANIVSNNDIQQELVESSHTIPIEPN